MTYSEHDQRLLDQQSPTQIAARQKADEIMADWIGTEYVCPEHGLVENDDEEPRCHCGELCEARPVFRNRPEEDLHPSRAPR